MTQPNPTPCPKCSGTGAFIGYTGRRVGDCFACNGTGTITPKPTPTALDPNALAPIIAAFERAAAALKAPKLTLGSFRISLAKPDSANPGALYVKRSGHYLGKITHATFIQSRECDNDTALAVARICRDPLGYALAHGRETGQCAICNRTLSDPASLAAGIGPVCAERFGWTIRPANAA